MAGLDIKRFLNNFNQNYARQTFTAQASRSAAPQNIQVSNTTSQTAEMASKTLGSSSVTQTTAQNLQLNNLQNIDRAIYAKEVMQLPRNLNEFVYMVQRGMTQTQFNQMFSAQLAAQRNSLSQLQAQILAQLQGLSTNNAKEMVNVQLASQVQGSLKNLEILSGGMIKLDKIGLFFQQNGKEAITKLIMSMTEASKAGISDLSQMKDMAKLINASVSIAAENNPQKTLKLLLLLYLPWLPLEEGTGFDVELQTPNGGSSESDSILNISVMTIHYGVVNATLVLETSNSVHVVVEAGEEFPRKELLSRVEQEQKHYSMDSVMTFTKNEGIKPVQTEKQTANVNMSQTTEINPYLLLMAHTLIKQIISIDNLG